VLQSLRPTDDDAKNRERILPVNRRLQQRFASARYAGLVVYLDKHGKTSAASKCEAVLSRC